MKRVLTLILALVMCASLCACGGNRDIASPGTADDEAADTNNTTTADDADNTDNDASVNEAETSGDEEAPENDNAQPNGGKTETPTSNVGSSHDIGNLDIDIKYDDNDMIYVEEPEDDMAVIGYGEKSNLYIQDVTGIYNPDTTKPADFLYDYAYDSCVELVTAEFGQIIQFNGESTIQTSGNELYGFGAHMTCVRETEVYAFIKLVTVDDGYAVMIGICEEADMHVFDDVELD